MTRGYFVVGTDTGVGKTFIACALLHALHKAGSQVIGMKPVAAGCERTGDGLINEDVEALRAASSVAVSREDINVYAFEPPIAPHIEAAHLGLRMDLDVIAARFEHLATRADVIVVEGAGGWLVPLNDEETFADLAVKLGLPVVLVVGMRLGCINHALLTADAILARGLELAGWVANHIDPHMERQDENVRAIEDRLAAPRLARAPFQPLADPRTVTFYSAPE